MDPRDPRWKTASTDDFSKETMQYLTEMADRVKKRFAGELAFELRSHFKSFCKSNGLKLRDSASDDGFVSLAEGFAKSVMSGTAPHELFNVQQAEQFLLQHRDDFVEAGDTPPTTPKVQVPYRGRGTYPRRR